MRKKFLYAGLLALACSCALADELYRWIDESGNVHYSDSPPSGRMDAERMKLNSARIDEDAGLSYEIRRAKQNFPVTLYVTENCGEICQTSRDFLRKRRIPFAEKVLVTQEDFDAFRQISGSDATPTLAVGKTWLKGFQVQQWSSELDIAGYP